jgi:hypothetical protein
MYPHGEADRPGQQLSALLTADFTSPEQRASQERATESGSALSKFLAHTRTTDVIKARLESPENAELGKVVERLLASAATTGSFKTYVVDEVRRAHAWETTVTDAIAPDRLGLMTGEGIFDPIQAPSIEAQAIRGYLFDVVREHVIVPDGTDETNNPLPPILPRPKQYAEEMARVVEWRDDYTSTFGEDPFEFAGEELTPFLDAAPRAEIVPPLELEDDDQA